MSENSKNYSEWEKRLYDVLSKNTFFSAHNKTASSLKKLADELEKANQSSSSLAKSLNRLTLAAVIIAAISLSVELYKIFSGVS
ncbi:hypothetical protein [Aliiglaciecola sp. NS0011-25]|uniref:hypothetical protein n=1 Tax=Aliiglaciecola sp. NS0011-25 TaxID=3127654 RepID=UPI003106C5A5